MDAYLAPLLVAVAASLALLLPVVLRSAGGPSERDTEWRDQSPLALRLLRPVMSSYARSVEASLGSHKRDVLQTRLNAAGATYLITPAEFLVLRRVAFASGAAAALYTIFVLEVSDPVYLSAAGSLAPFSYLYPDIWLRDATCKRQARFA
jgi:tight adherence protein C